MTTPAAPPQARGGIMTHYTSLAIFLLGALALSLPSGYSLGALMLVLASPILLIRPRPLELTREDQAILLVLGLYFAVTALSAWLDGQGSRGLDKPSRFLLAIPALLLLIAYPPRLSWLWHGLAIGGMATGGLAIWQKLIEGTSRAGGFTQIIQYGNISLLLGMLCLAGLGWAWAQPRRRAWLVWLGLGAAGGLLASLLSGSRGGWLVAPLMLLVLYWAEGRRLPRRMQLGLVMAVLIAGAISYTLPELGVQQRVHTATDNVANYLSGENRDTSVGLRFQMWGAAGELFQQRPLFGWGEHGYREAMAEMAVRGEIAPRVAEFHHAHNEWIDAAAKRGIIGITALLCLYLVPLVAFARRLNAPSPACRALAAAGSLLPIAYLGFGATQAFLEHNSGVMIYAFWLAVLWAMFRQTTATTAKDTTT
ncbi:O-antigen ligase family protein [Halomonas sp. 328]|nr:O-antigen ligase family protein [Halomonas sp. 328]